jgi:hypothetical protein
VEKRIALFLARLHLAEENNAKHPRRLLGIDDDESSRRQFFMPLLFGEDIHFDPFDSDAIGNEEENYYDFDKETRQPDFSRIDVNDFSDISRLLQLYRKRQARERKSLYAHSSDRKTPNEWTDVIHMTAVDWSKFFENERESLRERPVTPIVYHDYEKDFLDEMKSKLEELNAFNQSLQTSMDAVSTTTGSRVPTSFGRTKLVEMNEEIDIEPLPFGKVMTGVLLPSKFKYFQV